MPETRICKVCGHEWPGYYFDNHKLPDPFYEGVCGGCAFLKRHDGNGFRDRWGTASKEYILLDRAIAHSEGFGPDMSFPGGPFLLARLADEYLASHNINDDVAFLRDEFRKMGYVRAGIFIYDVIIFAQWLRYEYEKGKAWKQQEQILQGKDEKQRYDSKADYQDQADHLGQLLWHTEGVARDAVSINIKFQQQDRLITVWDKRLVDIMVHALADACKKSGVIDSRAIMDEDIHIFDYWVPGVSDPIPINPSRVTRRKGSDAVNDAVGLGLFFIQEYLDQIIGTIKAENYPAKTHLLPLVCQMAGIPLLRRDGSSMYDISSSDDDELARLRDRITDLYSQYAREEGVLTRRGSHKKYITWFHFDE